MFLCNATNSPRCRMYQQLISFEDTIDVLVLAIEQLAPEVDSPAYRTPS